MTKIRPLILIAMLMTATLAWADVELRQEHTFDVRSGQKVTVDVSFHRVEVTVEPGSQVHAVVEISTTSSSNKAKRAVEELRPVFEEKGDSIIIRSTRKGGWSSWSGNLKAMVRITMPPDLDLSVDSSSGSINVAGDLGDADVDCDASSGSVNIRGAMRNLTVDTSSGSIEVRVDRPLERFSADASSGSVHFKGGAKEAYAETSSGSITLLGLQGDADMEASSGSITGQWDSIPPETSIRAAASSGSVTLRLPESTEISGSADTSSCGVIRSDFPGTFHKKSATFNGGAGAVQIRIDTSSGSIKILAD